LALFDEIKRLENETREMRKNLDKRGELHGGMLVTNPADPHFLQVDHSSHHNPVHMYTYEYKGPQQVLHAMDLQK
jgi:hypothetical protein